MIEVNGSPVPASAGALLRQLLLFLGGLAVGKGWLSNDQMLQLLPIVVAVVTLVWGQVKTLRTHQKLVATAEAAPDSVATVK